MKKKVMYCQETRDRKIRNGKKSRSNEERHASILLLLRTHSQIYSLLKLIQQLDRLLITTRQHMHSLQSSNPTLKINPLKQHASQRTGHRILYSHPQESSTHKVVIPHPRPRNRARPPPSLHILQVDQPAKPVRDRRAARDPA